MGYAQGVKSRIDEDDFPARTKRDIEQETFYEPHQYTAPTLRQQRFQKMGYDDMRESLDGMLAEAKKLDVIRHVDESKRQSEQELVHGVGIKASNDVRQGVANQGPVDTTADERAYDRGQRRAIYEWSHENNQRIKSASHVAISEHLPQPTLEPSSQKSDVQAAITTKNERQVAQEISF